MGKSRAQRREASGLIVNLFSGDTALGYHVVRQVPIEFAIEMVALKQWREVLYQEGDQVELLGVQPLKPKPAERKTLSQVLIERLIATTITLPEVKRNAGLYGKSRTIGMPEWRRLQRHARFDESKILPPEDAIERAIEKVKQWPYPANVIGNDKDGAPIFGDRAVRVYPPAPQKQPTKGAVRKPAAATLTTRRSIA